MSGPDTPQGRDGPDDRELEEFLAGRGALRDAYRTASSEQPPATLDAAILAQAREATASVRTRRRVSRWQAPFASAAVIVLALGVWLQWPRDGARLAVPEAVPGTASVSAVAPAPVGASDVPSAPVPAVVVATENRADRSGMARAAEPSLAKAESLMRRKAAAPAVAPAEIAAAAAPPPAIPQERVEVMADQAPPPAAAPAPAMAAPTQMAGAAPSAPGVSMAAAALANAPASAFTARKSFDVEARERAPDLLETLCATPRNLDDLPRGDDGHLLTPLLWRGLPVVAVDVVARVIEFDPTVTAETIRRQWTSQPPASHCGAESPSLQAPLAPAGWRLHCGCGNQGQ